MDVALARSLTVQRTPRAIAILGVRRASHRLWAGPLTLHHSDGKDPHSVTTSVRSITFLVLAAAMLPLVAARADDQDTIDYRQDIMKSMGEQTAAIAQILQQKAPPDNFAVHLQILAITAATAKKAFEPKVPGGEAKSEVWAKWPDFSKRLDELTAATADLAKTAVSGGIAATAPKVQAALTCKSCHDTYRREQQK